jgi:hypothetical protein
MFGSLFTWNTLTDQLTTVGVHGRCYAAIAIMNSPPFWEKIAQTVWQLGRQVFIEK